MDWLLKECYSEKFKLLDKFKLDPNYKYKHIKIYLIIKTKFDF
jgi:hypothetical protein